MVGPEKTPAAREAGAWAGAGIPAATAAATRLAESEDREIIRTT